MSIKFKFNSYKDNSVSSFFKVINNISSRISISFENGTINVKDTKNINDSMIGALIDSICSCFDIQNVDFDNMSEESSLSDTTETAFEVTEEPSNAGTDTMRNIALEPQCEDDLIFKKVEFENEYVENRINNLLKTAYWALYNRHAEEKDIGEHILTCMSEISMRYSSNPIIEFECGDIVDVNYGSHLPGEIMGGHFHAIVCDIKKDKDMVYLVPITKKRTNILSDSYLSMDAPYDANYNNDLYYRGGTVLLDKGKYLRSVRINSVIGKTTPEFFKKLLYQLASTFDFTID